jgi:hypothetical protein
VPFYFVDVSIADLREKIVTIGHVVDNGNRSMQSLADLKLTQDTKKALSFS